jgi:hypothetical protein
MGNQQNTSLSDKKLGHPTNTTDIKEDKPEAVKDLMQIIQDTTKNLKAVTSDNITTTDYNEKSISNETTSVVTVTNIENKTESSVAKIPTRFEWREGGRVIYISGSFSNWTHWFIMKKKENGVFELVLDLPRGIYEYKFIVDNRWKYSLLQPTCKDSKGNVNNVISTILSDKEKMSAIPNDKEKVMTHEELNKNLAEEYTQFFPPNNDLNMDAPFVPYHYSIPFNLDCNSNQGLIGSSECISTKERFNYNANNSHKNIFNTPHVNL